MTIRAVIFDFGRVLGNFDKVTACQKLTSYHGAPPADWLGRNITAIESSHETDMISGDEFAQAVLVLLEKSPHSIEDVKRIWGDIFSPNHAIEPVIERLIAQGTPIAVLSNTNSIHWPFIRRLNAIKRLEAYGASFVLSFEVRARKPAPTMFQTALKELGAVPSETLFIDDLVAYVEAARNLGLAAEQYDCTIGDPGRIDDILSSYGL